MSSGGWEIVGKKNKDKNNGKAAKLTKAEKKNFIINSPKLEDFLPLNEVKSLYDSLDGNKENKKPAKEKDGKSKENEEKKKQQKLKQQQAEKNKSKQQQQKPKEKPKSTEKSSSGITVEELNNILESDKVKFPDAPLIWLKDLVSYLDAKLPAEKADPGLLSKPEAYPLSLLSKNVRSLLEKTIKAVGSKNAQLCWEGTLMTMIKNITNGTSDTGCKIFLQLLAQSDPHMTIRNKPKLESLRNSYQNKKPVGLSLLWAFAQAGKRDLSVGLTVWNEVMTPLLETRSYASYVVKILNDLLVAPENSAGLTKDWYLHVLNVFCLTKTNTPTSAEKDINVCLENLRLSMARSGTINFQEMFETLLRELTPKTTVQYRNEITKGLVSCLEADSRCLSVWTNSYSKNLYQSDLLLKHLLSEWITLRSRIDARVLKESLINLRECSVAPKKGKEESLRNSCDKTLKTLIQKMSAAKKKESSFPFKTGIIVLLVLIGAVITYDCQKHGSFEASSTGIFLKNSGITSHAKNGYSVLVNGKDKSLAYLESNFPEFYKIAAETTDKYVKLFGNLYLIARNVVVKGYLNLANYAAERKPLVVNNIEYYFPGMLDTLHKRSLIEIERVKTYSAIIQEQVIIYSVNCVRWMETNVFVGNLSPKSMRGYATQAVETTQQLASQTYDWVYEKVQTLSKIH